MKPSEKSKNTNELMQILSSAKTPEELQAYTETLKQEHISCSFVDFISEKLRERELSAADLIRNSMIQRNTVISFSTEPEHLPEIRFWLFVLRLDSI